MQTLMIMTKKARLFPWKVLTEFKGSKWKGAATSN